MSQLKVQVFGPPDALPWVLPLTDQFTSAALDDVLALNLTGVVSVSTVSGFAVVLAGLSMMSPSTEGPRPPTGLMIEEVWVTLWPVARVFQLSVTRTRL